MSTTKTNERIFLGDLVVRHRRSAVFFERVADIEKPNGIAMKYKPGSVIHNNHVDYVCDSELKCRYEFTKEEFRAFYEHCVAIADEAWTAFTPKEVDSLRADYDGYYDRDFENEGSLVIYVCVIDIEGPYAQPKVNGEIVRLIKFNKRKFEAFVYDLAEKVGASEW